MKAGCTHRIILVAVLSCLLSSCGGGGGGSASSGESSQSSTAPRIVSLTPSSVPPGSNDFTLTVNGANFPANAVIMFEQTQKATTFVSSTQLTTAVSKDEVAQGHNIGVNVVVPNVTAANGTVFKVEFPKPTITSISKTSAQVNDPGFTLTVNGSNFFSGAHVQWDGLDRVTQFISSTQLTAQIPSGDLAVGGNHTIRVSNPSPNAGISDGVNFFVQAPTPTITSITPDPAYANGHQTFTVIGTNFLSTSKISFDGGAYFQPFGGTATQKTFSSALPYRLGSLVIKVSNDGGGPATASRTITLVPSATGIQTSPVRGYLFTDDLQQVVYAAETSFDPTHPFNFTVAIRDTCIGLPSCTPQDHVIQNLGTPQNWPTYWPQTISADGRYIVYATVDPHPNYTIYGPEYVFDTCKGASAGCARTSYRITVPADGSAPNDAYGGGCPQSAYVNCSPIGEAVSMTANGRYLSFQSSAPNLVVGDNDSLMDIFFRDMCLGAPAGCVPTTQKIKQNAWAPKMSRDGRIIYYYPATGGLFAYDSCFGQASGCVPTEVQVNIDDAGSTAPLNFLIYAISPDGRYVAWNTYISYAGAKTYVRDTCLRTTDPCIPRTVATITSAIPRSLTPDGKYLAITTSENFGDPADTNGDDVYVIKTCIDSSTPCTQVAKRISVDEQGIQAGGGSPLFTPDGTRIVYGQLVHGVVITEPLTLP